jgi:dihydroorotate dehydrogenase
MKNASIKIRNAFIRFGYRYILKPVFFRMDPEDIHNRMTVTGKFLGRHWLTKKLSGIMFRYSNKTLEQDILGIHFPNPIGLSAGFDKNAELTDILPEVGFGFVEVGSITGEPSSGNPRPRLWRLKKSEALVVNYGLKNDGCEKISRRLKGKHFKIPTGISVAKTNSKDTVETEKGIHDYAKAFRHFIDIGDYFTINISCPNAYGGQPFTDPNKLEKLLEVIDRIHTDKPVFLKFSPDLTRMELDDIIHVAEKHRVHGFIGTNLTKNRQNPKIVDKDLPGTGGISGKVLEDLSNDMIRYIYRKTKGKFIIIGSGGVFSAQDAYKKIKAGASLIQLITGMIFDGPQIVSSINMGLVELLKRDGYSNISEAVGKEHR